MKCRVPVAEGPKRLRRAYNRSGLSIVYEGEKAP